ncbi:MAG: UvrD-helicase domain-containing protein, partial [bacterium]
MEPNSQQKKLIENRRGIYLVDAGAGTGKTFTLSRRYASILANENVSPDRILLITFTNNAAEEMKERVINCCDYDPLDLQEAPISTFHSLCHRLLIRHGFNAPRLLGIEEHVTTATSILQNEVQEKKEFRRFLHRFIDNYPGYHDLLRVLRDRSCLLGLIKSLAAKGIIPLVAKEKHKWYQRGEDYLDGHFEHFQPVLQQANAPRQGKNSLRQSDLLERIKGSYRSKCFYRDAPDLAEVIETDGKQVVENVVRAAFAENREKLKEFIHELYSGYLRYCLQNNYLNFGFLQVLAYVLLSEDSKIRREMKHRFVMVDEFQDTSEIQFKLTLLLSEMNNICVVGDWKQSIYSFQYANVDNIREFETRIKRYKDELNSDKQRVNYSVADVTPISLQENYRSGQEILDFSEKSLLLEATDRERFDSEAVERAIVSLKGGREQLPVEIKGILSQDEPEAVLMAARRLVEQKYPVVEEECERAVNYADIAV